MRLRHIADQLVKEWAPREEFMSQYNVDGETINVASMNPDSFYGIVGAIPFIYTDEHDLLWEEDEDDTHLDLINNHYPYFVDDGTPPGNVDEDDIMTVRQGMEEEGHLIGRISPNADFIAFWNQPSQLYNNLKSCILELLKNNLITPNTIIVLNGHDDAIKAVNTEYLNDVNTKIDPAKEREAQLRKELHLMRPQAKKAAMKELGLSFGSRKNPWQKASEKEGLVQPGQKWWAMSSESRKDNHML